MVQLCEGRPEEYKVEYRGRGGWNDSEERRGAAGSNYASRYQEKLFHLSSDQTLE